MEYSRKNIVAYIQGKLRDKVYNTKLEFLISKHIREQIDARLESMEPKCYLEGQCIICGCETIALQMANKACDKPCYPPMLDKETWSHLKDYRGFWLDKENNIIWHLNDENKFIMYK